MHRYCFRSRPTIIWLTLALAGCAPGGSDTDAASIAGQAAEGAAAALPDQPTLMRIDQIGMEGGRGLYVARRDAGETRIAFDVPVARVAPERLHDMEQLGETPEGVVVVLDRYASRADADGRCAEGRETFVRAFSLQAGRELFSQPVQSCHANIVGGTPPVTWLGNDRFRIEGSAPTTYVITGTDRVSPVAAEGAHG